jgi:oxygen-independent coproporphyrinogen-3 oxidase
MKISKSIIDKYNVAVPRYTSYPTVPHWQSGKPSTETFLHSLKVNLRKDNRVSLYIHLPYCDNLCTYCGCNKRITKNHAVEHPYIQTVLQEWKMITDQLDEKPVIEAIHLGGGTPTFFSAENLEILISGLLSKGIVAEKIAFSFEAHPRSTSEDHLVTLYNLGFRRMSVGVQDVSPFILKAINRYQNLDQIIHSVDFARTLGYDSINFDLVYGLPFQTLSDIEETTEFVREMKPDRIAYYGYAHVPWKSKGQRAFTDKDIPRGYKKYLLRYAAEKKLKSIGYQSLGLDHYALPGEELSLAFNKGKLLRNFMGYTTSPNQNLIGLGVSSISEISDHYMQNEKTVEAYSAKIKAGLFAYIKGHSLSHQEQHIKSKIMHLMCNGELSWSHYGLISQVIHKNRSELEIMEKDGLLISEKNSFRLTESGQYLVRNISALLDPYFVHQSSQIFSQAI